MKEIQLALAEDEPIQLILKLPTGDSRGTVLVSATKQEALKLLMGVQELRLRLMADTIKLGDIEINAPYRVEPKYDSIYYVPLLTNPFAGSYIWTGSKLDYVILNKNACFKTADDAIKASNAISELLK